MLIKRGGLVLLSIFLAASFVPLNTFADETASSTFSIDVSNAALQVTAPPTATIVLDPASSTFFGSTNITVNVATNNMTGYTITMSVPTTDLTHTEITGANAPIIPTLESQAPQSTFPSNAWGYKVTGDNFRPVQLTNTNSSWVTKNPTNGTDHIITLAAKVDGMKQAGTYTNTLTFNVVANPTSARDIITFDANGGTGSMDSISVPAGDTVTLPQNTFTAPEGYRFSGWNAVQTNVSSTKNIGVYTNKAAYTAADTGINRQITLYAEWTNLPCAENCDDPEPDPTTGAVGTTIARAYEIAYTAKHKGMYEQTAPNSTHYEEVKSWDTPAEQYKNLDVRFAMHDMTPEICASVTVMHDDYQALDVRDDKLYHITKLKDGNCWMTQNLDLSISSSSALDSTTSDINQYDAAGYTTSTGYTMNGGVIYWQPNFSDITTINAQTGQVSNWGWELVSYTPRSFEPGDWYWIGNWTKQDGTSTYYGSRYETIENNYLMGNAGNVFAQSPYTGNGMHGHVGNYYNWAAIIATNNSSYYIGNAETDPSLRPQNSICPKGWRLPTSTNASDGDWAILISQYPMGSDITADKTYVGAPIWLVRGGVVSYNSYFGGPGHNAAYTTDSYTNNYDVRTLRFSPSGVGPFSSGVFKTSGMSVRCLAR